MLKTVIIIVLSVTVFGVMFFLYVKKSLKKQLDYYLSKNNKKKKKINQIILQNFVNSTLEISRTFFEVS